MAVIMMSDPSPFSALLVVAHCDDAELWAGGTISQYLASGWDVIVAIAYHSSKRRREAISSSKILGSQVVFRNGNQSIADWILDLIREQRPTVFFTHQDCDPHFEHSELFESALVALTRFQERKERPLRWFSFDTYYLTRVPTTCPVLVDITDHFDRKCESLRCHSSQNPEHLIEMARCMNMLHGQKIRVDFAEAFYPFSLLGRWPRLRDLP